MLLIEYTYPYEECLFCNCEMDCGNFLRLAFAGLLIDLQVLQLQSKALSLRKAQVGFWLVSIITRKFKFHRYLSGVFIDFYGLVFQSHVLSGTHFKKSGEKLQATVHDLLNFCGLR